MFYTRPQNINNSSMYTEPVENPTTSFMDVFRTSQAADDAGREVLSSYWNLSSVYDEHNAKVKALTGVDLENPRKRYPGSFADADEMKRYREAITSYRRDGGTASTASFYERWGEQEYRRKLDELVEKFPDRKADLLPESTFQQQAYGKVQAAEAAAQKAYEGYGSNARLPSFLGSVWGMHDDPVFWMTAPVGFGGAGTGIKGLTMAALKNGTANAAVEAAMQPFIQSYRSEAGVSSGFADAATAVGAAFVGGAAIDATVRGTARALRYHFGYEPVVRDGVVVSYQKKDKAGAVVSEIPAETVARADAEEAPAIREIAEKTGLADREPVVRTALNAMDANERLLTKPVATVPDVEHQAAVAQALRHVADPETEPLPVVHEVAGVAELRRLEWDIAEARKELAQVVRAAGAPQPPESRAILIQAVEAIQGKIQQMTEAFETQSRVLLSEDLIFDVASGGVSREVADVVAQYVPDKSLHSRMAADLMERKPASPEQARQMVHELLRSPDYRPRRPDPAPAPGLNVRALDDPFGADAKAQVQFLERQMSEELGVKAPMDTVKPGQPAKAAPEVEAEPKYRDPSSGEPLDETDVTAIVDMWRYVRETRSKRPETLSSYLVRMGRIQDQNGELTNILGGKARYLISNRGMTLDDAAFIAHETGFFFERPDIATFLDAIDNDVRGNYLFRDADAEVAENWRVAQQMEEDLGRLGIDDAKSEAEIRAYLRDDGQGEEGLGSRQAAAGGAREERSVTTYADAKQELIRRVESGDYDEAEFFKLKTLVENEIADVVARMGGTDVKVMLTPDGIEGGYKDDGIFISMLALDPKAIIRHEEIHALRARGLFSGQEWSLLTRKADESGIFDEPFLEGKRSIREVYPEIYGDRFAGDEAALANAMSEEAVAYMVQRRAGGADYGEANTFLDRVRAFLERVRNVLTGYGFQTADDVLAAIEAGAMWQRPQLWGPGAREAMYAKPSELKSERRLADPIGWGRITKRGSERRIAELMTRAERLAESGDYETASRLELLAKEYEDLLEKFDDDLPRGKPFERSKVMRSGDFVVRLTTDERHGADSTTKVFRIYRGTESDISAMRQPSKQLGSTLGEVTISQRDGGLWEVDYVEVKERQRGRGVAKALYAAVEGEIGVKMRPSGILLPDGYAMWKRRAPDLVKYHVEVDEVFYSPRRLLKVAADYRDSEQFWRAVLHQDQLGGRLKEAAEAEKFAARSAANAQAFEDAFAKVPDEGKTPEMLWAMFALRSASGAKKAGADARAKNLTQDLADIEDLFKASGGDERTKLQAKRAALLNARSEELALDDVNAYRDYKGRSDPAKAFILLHESFGDIAAKDLKHARDVIQNTALELMEKVIWGMRKGAITGDLRRVLNPTVKTTMVNMIKEAAGENTNDATAKVYAKAWADASEFLRQRFNAAGGDIGKLKNWIMPQYHDPEALMKMGKLKWIDYIMKGDMLDRAAMVDPRTGKPYTNSALRASLEYVWKNITSNGEFSREITGRSGRGAMYKRHADHRFIIFKDADSWIKYQKEAGGGDFYSTMIGHISMMSRDIAAMERFGANPEIVRERLKQHIIKEASQARPMLSMFEEMKELVDDLKAQYKGLPTRYDQLMAEMSKLHTQIDAVRSKSAPQLHGRSKRSKAKIEDLQQKLFAVHEEMKKEMQSATPLTPEQIDLQNRINEGLDEMARLDVPPVMSRDPAQRARRLLARADEMWAAYSGSSNVPADNILAGFFQGTRNIASSSMLVFAPMSAVTDQSTQLAARLMIGIPATRQLWSFIKGFTPADRKLALATGLGLDQAQAAFELQARYLGNFNTQGITGYLVDRTHALSFLSPMTQASKTAFGLDAIREFTTLVQRPWKDLSDNTADWLSRNGFTEADWKVLQAVEPQDMHGVKMLTRRAIEKVDPDLAEKYQIMIMRGRGKAVLEGTMRGRTLLVSDTQKGSLTGEAARSFAMLKSFPISYSMLVLGELYGQIMRGRYYSAAAYGSAIFIVGSMLGALAIQMKNIGQGRDPEDMTEPKFWGRAFAQSGGAGIYGDFISSAVGRNGQGLTDTLAGPIFDQFGSVLDMTAGTAMQYAKDEPVNVGRKVTNFMRKNTPGALAPWYIRTAYERMIIDELQKQIDPDAHKSFRSKISNRKRVFGNEFFWPPGQSSAQRSPDVGAAFGN